MRHQTLLIQILILLSLLTGCIGCTGCSAYSSGDSPKNTTAVNSAQAQNDAADELSLRDDPLWTDEEASPR